MTIVQRGFAVLPDRLPADPTTRLSISLCQHDLVGDNEETLPKNRSEEKRWSSAVRRDYRSG